MSSRSLAVDSSDETPLGQRWRAMKARSNDSSRPRLSLDLHHAISDRLRRLQQQPPQQQHGDASGGSSVVTPTSATPVLGDEGSSNGLGSASASAMLPSSGSNGAPLASSSLLNASMVSSGTAPGISDDDDDDDSSAAAPVALAAGATTARRGKLALRKPRKEILAKLMEYERKLDTERKVRKGYEEIDEAQRKLEGSGGKMDKNWDIDMEKKLQKSDMKIEKLEKKLEKYRGFLEAAPEKDETSNKVTALDLVKSTKRFLAEPFTNKKEKKSGKERAEKDQTMAMSFEANAQRSHSRTNSNDLPSSQSLPATMTTTSTSTATTTTSIASVANTSATASLSALPSSAPNPAFLHHDSHPSSLHTLTPPSVPSSTPSSASTSAPPPPSTSAAASTSQTTTPSSPPPHNPSLPALPYHSSVEAAKDTFSKRRNASVDALAVANPVTEVILKETVARLDSDRRNTESQLQEQIGEITGSLKEHYSALEQHVEGNLALMATRTDMDALVQDVRSVLGDFHEEMNKLKRHQEEREKELDDQIESLQEQLTSSMSKTQLLESQLLHFSTPSRLFRFLKSVLNVLLTFFAVLLAQGFNLFMFFKALTGREKNPQYKDVGLANMNGEMYAFVGSEGSGFLPEDSRNHSSSSGAGGVSGGGGGGQAGDDELFEDAEDIGCMSVVRSGANGSEQLNANNNGGGHSVSTNGSTEGTEERDDAYGSAVPRRLTNPTAATTSSNPESLSSTVASTPRHGSQASASSDSTAIPLLERRTSTMWEQSWNDIVDAAPESSSAEPKPNVRRRRV